jgi:hypothetical protein
MDALWRDKSKSEQPPSGTFVRRFPSMANNAALRPSWIRLQENPGWAAARQSFQGAPAKKTAASQGGSPNRDRVTTLATNKNAAVAKSQWRRMGTSIVCEADSSASQPNESGGAFSGNAS